MNDLMIGLCIGSMIGYLVGVVVMAMLIVGSFPAYDDKGNVVGN